MEASAGLAVQASFLVVLGVGGARVAGGALPVSSLIAFLLYLLLLSEPLTALVNGVDPAAGRAGRGGAGCEELHDAAGGAGDGPASRRRPPAAAPASVAFDRRVVPLPGRTGQPAGCTAA